MGSYIGKKPTDVPLTSSDINDNIITSAKIVDGAITGDDINSTFNIGSKTVTLPAASVTAHASDYIDWQSVVTASTLTAVAGKGYPINTTSNACTVTLPGSASVGDTIKFVDYARNWGTNAVTINQNSLNFQGNTSPNPTYNTNGQAVTLTYVDATKGWIPTVDDESTFETPQPYNIDILIVAGGGGSLKSNTGGGGGGGMRKFTGSTITGGTEYTCTVGAGGVGLSSGAVGNDGGDSSFSGSGFTTLTSTGGGGGVSGSETGRDGGAGGGAGYQGANKGGHGNTPSTTPSQGADGGEGTTSSPNYPGHGGGGGGASGANGQNAPNNSDAGDGGDGTADSITGSSVTYAGGGGGACEYGGAGGTGGAGGGGDGKNDNQNVNGDDGTDGLGGGGGGTYGGSYSGGSGGSGVVILRIPTANYTGQTTGSPTVTTDGSYKVVKFTATGTYTA